MCGTARRRILPERGTRKLVRGLLRWTGSGTGCTRSRSTCATRSHGRRSACTSTRGGSTRRRPRSRNTRSAAVSPDPKNHLTLALRAKQDVRRNHRRGRARRPADRDVRRCSGKANGAERAPQGTDRELAVNDDFNFPVAVGTGAEQLRMAASQLVLW